MNAKYNDFKSSLMVLERIEAFKRPFTRLYESVIFSYSVADLTGDEGHCEYYLLDGDEETKEIVDKYMETVQDVEKELGIVALKLAKLLQLKEDKLKENVIEYAKNN